MKRMMGRAKMKPMVASTAATMSDIRSVCAGDVADAAFIAFAAKLRDEHGAGDRQPAAQRDAQKRDGKTERDGRHGLGAQAADPEGVGQLIGRLQDVGQNDGDRQPQQRQRDRPFRERRIGMTHRPSA